MLPDHVDKSVKKIDRVVGARCMFRVILDGEGRVFFVAHPFKAVIVEIDMSHLYVISWQTLSIEAEAMVLGCYLHMTGAEIFDRLIASAVTKFQFICFAAAGQAEYLMSKAYTEYGFFPEKILDCIHYAVNAFWVARPVGEEDAIRVHAKHRFCSSCRRHHLHLASFLSQQSELVEFYAEVKGDYLKWVCKILLGCCEICTGDRPVVGPSIWLIAGHSFDHVLADKARPVQGSLYK